MRIAVIGAGLAGVTTAYELARDGHEIIVYERRASISAEGSFAPACVNAPELGYAMAAVGPRAYLPTGMASHPSTWAWLAKAWRTSRQPAEARHQAMADLARLSLERLRQISDLHELDYERHDGVLAIFRQPGQATRAQAMLARFAGSSPMHWVDAGAARRIEPGLDDRLPLLGGLHWPAGQTANGRQFAHALKAEAQRLGARFVFHQAVTALAAGAAGLIELRSQPCTELADSGLPAPASTLLEEPSSNFDAAVLCSASAARLLLPRLRLPLGMAHVHTVTAPLGAAAQAGDAIGPRGALLDLAAGISIARMGERVRVAGSARCGAPPARPDERQMAALFDGLDRCFPGAARTARAHAWVGRQSLLPDGLPAVGNAGRGLWLNLGHGAGAWSWAPASARLIAELLGGGARSLDPAPFDPARLR